MKTIDGVRRLRMPNGSGERGCNGFTIKSGDVSTPPMLERLVPHALAALGHVSGDGWLTQEAITLRKELSSYFAFNYPVSIRALCAIIATASILPPHYKIAVAMRNNPKHDRFIIEASGVPRRGWDDSADLRIITDETSLTAFLSGKLDASDPNALFLWTGRHEAWQQLEEVFAELARGQSQSH